MNAKYNINDLPNDRHCVIDISHWHPITDASLIPDKVAAVAVKVCQGDNSDPKAWDNIDALASAKIPTIIYNFVAGESTAKWQDWLAEAQRCPSIVGAMVDVERTDGTLPKKQICLVAAFLGLREIPKVWIYGNHDDLVETFSGALSGPRGLWIANYNVSPGGDVPIPQPFTSYDLHQFTDSCQCPGFAGLVDCSVCSHDTAAWLVEKRKELRS